MTLRFVGNRFWPGVTFALAAVVLLAAAGCHSYHVDVTVENHTGAPIQLLEVDYPSASFGADQLAAESLTRMLGKGQVDHLALLGGP